MPKPETIQVFEYNVLRVGERGFQLHHFDQLVRYNERHGNQFFTVGHRKITFKSYVGVIQVGALVIEILPKADSDGQDVNRWHHALVNLLRACGYLKLHSLTNASLQLRSASLVDLYFDAFLTEVEELLHKGLTKRYRFREGNLHALKGKLVFSRQVTTNLVHQERFYTRHQVYDQDNIYNQILKKALQILRRIATNHYLQHRAAQRLFDLEEISDIQVQESTFDRLRFNRKTEAYRYAIQLARLIILQYAPDLKGGRDDLLAILFDMNRLFEQYIFRQLKRVEGAFSDVQLHVQAQANERFWNQQSLRPDILLEYIQNGKPQTLIIDTKWKVLDRLAPSEADLRQLYAYNLHFGADRSVLLYPKVHLESTGFIAFSPSRLIPDIEHACGLYFVEVVDQEGRLVSGMGKRLVERLLQIEDTFS